MGPPSVFLPLNPNHPPNKGHLGSTWTWTRPTIGCLLAVSTSIFVSSDAHVLGPILQVLGLVVILEVGGI